ncbi:MAG: hypothetical protein AABZ74_14045 [Cyanobacteriota bacterium]
MIKKIFTLFLVFNLILVSSCVPTNKSTINNNNNNNNNTFKTKADVPAVLIPTKMDESFLPKILKKSANIPIQRSINTTYPHNQKLEFQGLSYKPMKRKQYFHKALTTKEIKEKRKEALNVFKKLKKEEYKKLRLEMKVTQKNTFVLEMQRFKDLLKYFEKGSSEYLEIVQEQITERENLIAENRSGRQALYAQYKKELVEFKQLLNDILPIPVPTPRAGNNFNTKFLGIQDCGVFQGFCDWWDEKVEGKIGNKPAENTDYNYYPEEDPNTTPDPNYNYIPTPPANGEKIPDTTSTVTNDTSDPESETLWTIAKNMNYQDNQPHCTGPVIGYTAKKQINGLIAYQISLNISNQDQTCSDVDTIVFNDKSTDTQYCNDDFSYGFELSNVGTSFSFYYEPPAQGQRAGNYEMNVSFKMKNGKTYTEKIPHQIFGTGADVLANLGLYYLEPKSVIPHSQGTSNDINFNSNIGFHIVNTTGNYVDMALVDLTGKEIFLGKCLTIKEGDIVFDKNNLPKGDYVFSVAMSNKKTEYRSAPFHIEPGKIIPISTFFLSKDTKSENIDDINNYFDGSNGSLSEIKIINDWGIEWTHNLDSIVFTPNQSELSKSLGLIKIDKNNINGITNCFVKNTLDKITSGTRLSSEKNIYDDGSNYQSGHVLGDGKVYEINRNNNQLISILNKLKDSSFKQETAENCINEKGLIIGAIADLTNESKLVISDDSFLDFKLVLKDGNGNNIAWKNIKLKNRKINFITAKFNSLQTNELGLYNFQTVRNLRGNFKIELEPSHSYQTIKVKNESIASVNLQNCNNLNDDAKFYFDGLFYKGSILRFQSDVIYYSVKASGNTLIAVGLFFGYAFKVVSDLFSNAEKACDNTKICRAAVAIGQAASQPSTQLPPEKPPIICGSNGSFDKNCADTSTEVQKEKTEIDKNVPALATTDGSCTSSDNKNLLDAIAKLSYSAEQFDIHFPNFITNNNKIDIINKGKNNGTLFEAVKSTGFSVKSELNQDENIGLAVAIISDERNTTFKKMIANFSYLNDNTKKAEDIIRNKGIDITYPIIDQNHSTLVNSLSKDFNIAKKSNSVDEQVKVFLKEAYVFKTLSEKYTFKQDISISDFNILEKLKNNMSTQKLFLKNSLVSTKEQSNNFQKIENELDVSLIELNELISERSSFNISSPVVLEETPKLEELKKLVIERKIALKNCDEMTEKLLKEKIWNLGKQIINIEGISASAWAAVNIIMSVGASSSIVGVPSEMNNLALGIDLELTQLPSAIHEAASVLYRSSQKDCVDNSDNSFLSPRRLEIKNFIERSRLLLETSARDLETKAITPFEYNQIMKDLEKKLNEFRFYTIEKIKQDIDQECDECKNYGDLDTKENLECRINKLSDSERNNFSKTIKIRRAFVNNKKNVNNRTIGFVQVYQYNSYKSTIVGLSGDVEFQETESNMLIDSISKNLNINKSYVTLAKTAYGLGIEPVFISDKTYSGKPLQNDAEIKIFETANEKYKKEDGILINMVTDRVTCVYCQEVIRKLRRKEIKNSILTLGILDGKVIYANEKVSPEKLTIIENILKTYIK